MRKLSLGIVGLFLALTLSVAPAYADTAEGAKATGYIAHTVAVHDVLPALPAATNATVPATTAAYTLNDVVAKHGVTLVYRDFRTVADSGGLVTTS